MQIKVKTLTGKEIPIDVDPTDTVSYHNIKLMNVKTNIL